MKTTGITLCMALCVAMCSLSALSVAQQKKESLASKAFQQLKTLEGKWKATTEQGAAAYLYYEIVSNGSALHERFIDEGNKKHSNIITMYYLNKNNLDAAHFCSMNNQPFLRGSLDPSNPKQVTLTAYQVSNPGRFLKSIGADNDAK